MHTNYFKVNITFTSNPKHDCLVIYENHKEPTTVLDEGTVRKIVKEKLELNPDKTGMGYTATPITKDEFKSNKENLPRYQITNAPMAFFL